MQHTLHSPIKSYHSSHSYPKSTKQGKDLRFVIFVYTKDSWITCRRQTIRAGMVV